MMRFFFGGVFVFENRDGNVLALWLYVKYVHIIFSGKMRKKVVYFALGQLSPTKIIHTSKV
jgi:hypothetical protein